MALRVEQVPDLERLDGAVEAAIAPARRATCACSATARSRSCSAGRPRAARVRRQAAAAVPRPRAARALRASCSSATPARCARRGVGVVPTELRAARRGRRRRCAPTSSSRSCRASGCSTRVLRDGRPGDAAPRCSTTLVEHGRARSSTTRVGLDAQASNWAVRRTASSRCFDVSTPLHARRRRPRTELDLDALPVDLPVGAARACCARRATVVMAQYHDARTVLVDVASNLHQGAARPLAAGAARRGRTRAWRPPIDEARGAPLLRPRQAAVAADAAPAPRRPRLAAARAPPALPVPAAAALPLRTPRATRERGR